MALQSSSAHMATDESNLQITTGGFHSREPAGRPFLYVYGVEVVGERRV